MTTSFFNQIENLPAPQRQILLDFAEYLIRKYAPESKQKKNRKAGTMKGFLLYMSDDFNSPLDDFKEYMQ